MSLNLVDLVKQQVGSSVTSQIASALGEDSGAVQSAVDGAVPSILGGLISSSGNDEGRGVIGNLLEKQDTSMLSNLTGAIGGGNHQSLVNQGTGILSGLFGGNSAVGGLAGAVSRASGLGSGSSTSLISMLAPVVMGVVKQTKDTTGMDNDGVFSMLASQKDNVANAMPAQFASQLGDAGILDRMSGGLTDGVRGVAGAATGAVSGAASAAGNVAGNVAGAASDAVSGAAHATGDAVSGAVGNVSNAVGNVAGGATDLAGRGVDAVSDGASAAVSGGQQAAKSGGSLLGKLLPIAVILAGAFFVWNYFMGKDTDVTTDVAKVADTATETASNAADTATEAASNAADTATETASNVADSATAAVAGADVDVTEQLTGVFSGATGALEGITDVDSANAALPKLQELGSTVEGLSGTFDSLPEAVSGPARSLIGEKLSGLTSLVDKVGSIPGVGDIVQPVIAPIMNQLASMGG